MPLESLSQLAIGTLSVLILGFVVKKFLEHLEKRDDAFNNLITNHLAHHTEALDKLSDKIDRITK